MTPKYRNAPLVATFADLHASLADAVQLLTDIRAGTLDGTEPAVDAAIAEFQAYLDAGAPQPAATAPTPLAFPWRVAIDEPAGGGTIEVIAADGGSVCFASPLQGGRGLTLARAERLVASVNALAGLSDLALAAIDPTAPRRLPAWLLASTIDRARIVGDNDQGEPFTYEVTDTVPLPQFDPGAEVPIPGPAAQRRVPERADG